MIKVFEYGNGKRIVVKYEILNVVYVGIFLLILNILLTRQCIQCLLLLHHAMVCLVVLSDFYSSKFDFLGRYLAFQSMDNQIRIMEPLANFRWKSKKVFKGHMVSNH